MTTEQLQALTTSPFYAIEIDATWAQPHPPLVDEETWIAANAKTIEEVGAAAWLRGLLTGLKNPPDPDGLPAH